MKKYYNRLNVLITPTDYCNLDCIYCFHKTHHRENKKMSFETLEQSIKIIIQYYDKVTFIWHGGEPLSVGKKFYEKVLYFQKKYNTNKTVIVNQMQSNLTLLDLDFAKFLISNNFGLGGSFDGISNELTRGNTDYILQGHNLLKDINYKCGMIFVLSKININKLIENYEYFKNKRINFTVNYYINSNGSGKSLDLELDENDTVKAMIKLFDYWINDIESPVKINYFIHIMKYIINGEKSICCHTSCLGKWISIRPNGDVTPCNRYFPNEYTYGNVNNFNEINDAFESEGYMILLEKAIKRRNQCKACSIFDYCSGGCNNLALNENGIESSGGKSCRILIQVYNYIKQRLNLVLNEKNNVEYNPIVNKIIRN